MEDLNQDARRVEISGGQPPSKTNFFEHQSSLQLFVHSMDPKNFVSAVGVHETSVSVFLEV